MSWTAPNANGLTIGGYEVQFRKKVADGETPETWTTHTYTDANEVETSVLAASARSQLPYWAIWDTKLLR